MAIIDLSHTIEDGMVTYPGLPGPIVCDFMNREASRANYATGTEFQIGRIDMVSNTGTYLDTPFHRFNDGEDLADVTVGRLADLPGWSSMRPGRPRSTRAASQARPSRDVRY